MNKYCGNREDYTPIRQDESRYVISYGLEEAPNGLYTWYEIHIYKKQKSNISFKDVKDAILADINERVKNNIISGFVWNEKPVYLSTENQFNFKAAYDLAVQTKGESLPATFKLGEQDGAPVYHTFEELTEFTDFYTKAVAYINQTLAEGWQKKDGFDWSLYVDTE